VTKKFFIGLVIAALSVLAVACQQSGQSNANANAADVVASTTAGPDNSEITTTTDANGTKTETRVFRNNPRVSKVVVTTRNGNRTVKVYSRNGEERELKSQPERALEATGDAIADAAGWVAEKTETAAEKTKEGAKTAAEKTGKAAKTVGEKTAEGAKTVGQKTKEGAKKTGKAIKKVVTP
jgi:hypothetical protein